MSDTPPTEKRHRRDRENRLTMAIGAECGAEVRTVRRWLANDPAILPVTAYAIESAIKKLKLADEVAQFQNDVLLATSDKTGTEG